MAIWMGDLLRKVPPEVEARVRTARDRHRNAVRDALRAECRLAMRSDIDDRSAAAQVAIELDPGLPEPLDDLAFPDEAEMFLVLSRHRRCLHDTESGTRGLPALLRELRQVRLPTHGTLLDEGSISPVNGWARAMLELVDRRDPIRTILGVNEDVLGAYHYRANLDDEYGVNAARISLYWGVIGIVSDGLGCSAEDLTVVVMTHELAHAYTQLGADIDGRRWPSREFAEAEVDLKEGLAQYYTWRALLRLQGRLPGAMGVFSSLLEKQPSAYHAHTPWIDAFSPEALRQALIGIRRWRERTWTQFTDRANRAEKDLQPPRPSRRSRDENAGLEFE